MMMLDNLHNALKSENDVFDIILYGSNTKGSDKPGDIGIYVLFIDGTVRERTEETHDIKEKIKQFGKIDIQQGLITDLFNPAHFARSALLLEGVSIIYRKPFCERMGFASYALFAYSLRGKTHTEKVQFTHLLSGRTTTGLLEQLSGARITNGAVKIPTKNELIFEQILTARHIPYTKKRILEER